MVVFGLQEDDAVAHFGTLIYCLDRLYKAVKKPAKATGEWSRSVHVFLWQKVCRHLFVPDIPDFSNFMYLDKDSTDADVLPWIALWT